MSVLCFEASLSSFPLQFMSEMLHCFCAMDYPDFPSDSLEKNLPANSRDARDTGSIPVLGRSLVIENGNPLQYSCMENFMDRGAWQAIVCGVAKVRHKWVSEHACPTWTVW